MSFQHGAKASASRKAQRGRSALTHSTSGIVGGQPRPFCVSLRRLDHRDDPRLEGFGQAGPGIDHGGQVGVALGQILRNRGATLAGIARFMGVFCGLCQLPKLDVEGSNPFARSR